MSDAKRIDWMGRHELEAEVLELRARVAKLHPENLVDYQLQCELAHVRELSTMIARSLDASGAAKDATCEVPFTFAINVDVGRSRDGTMHVNARWKLPKS